MKVFLQLSGAIQDTFATGETQTVVVGLDLYEMQLHHSGNFVHTELLQEGYALDGMRGLYATQSKYHWCRDGAGGEYLAPTFGRTDWYERVTVSVDVRGIERFVWVPCEPPTVTLTRKNQDRWELYQPLQVREEAV